MASDAEISEILGAKKLLYVFATLNFADADSDQGGSYWIVDTCVYFTGTFAIWHNCRGFPNRIYRSTEKH